MVMHLLFAILLLSVVTAAPTADQLVSPLPGGYPAFLSNNYAGYLDLLDGRQGYYWFVESENDPSTDPLMFWFNGGPGCSSLLGLFTEIGPFIIQNGNVWGRNYYSWVTNMSVVFMESPGGVGFSPDLPDQHTVWNDTYVAQLNYAGVQSWLAKFPEYSGRPLYIAGESYAGHYVPQLVYQIVTGPDLTLRSMLKGFMAGNPCTGSYDGSDLDLCFALVDPTLEQFIATHALGSLDPTIPTEPTPLLPYGLPYDPYDDLVRTCPGSQALLLRRRSGRPVLEHDGVGDGASYYAPCATGFLTTFLNDPSVQKAIHASPNITVWSPCYDAIDYPTPLNNTQGSLQEYRYLIANTSLNILVYSGTSDTVVNFIQTQRILLSLGAPNSEFSPWYYLDSNSATWYQVGGYYLMWNRFAWAGVRGAGHMVPTYQPAAAKALLDSFLLTGKPGLLPRLSNGSLVLPPVTATVAPVDFTPMQSPTVSSDAASGLTKGESLMVGLLSTGFIVGILTAILTTQSPHVRPLASGTRSRASYAPLEK